MNRISPALLHAYFGMTLAAYLLGLILVFTVFKMAKAMRLSFNCLCPLLTP